MASTICRVCHKGLKKPKSVAMGMGPVCSSKAGSISINNQDHIDLPFDPVTKDILMERRADGVHFNIHQSICYHSPAGFEWGYAGSGPADLALNILEMFMREVGEDPSMALPNIRGNGMGAHICAPTWNLHQDFKEEFLLRNDAKITIKGDVIRDWIKQKLNGVKPDVDIS